MNLLTLHSAMLAHPHTSLPFISSTAAGAPPPSLLYNIEEQKRRQMNIYQGGHLVVVTNFLYPNKVVAIHQIQYLVKVNSHKIGPSFP